MPVLRLGHPLSFNFSGNTLINMLEVSLLGDSRLSNWQSRPLSVYLINKDKVLIYYVHFIYMLYSLILPYAVIGIKKLKLIQRSHRIKSHSFPQFHKISFIAEGSNPESHNGFYCLSTYHSLLIDPPCFLDFPNVPIRGYPVS